MKKSDIAKSGYANEQWLADVLNNWENNLTSRQIITAMGHDKVTRVLSMRGKDRNKIDVHASIYKEGGGFAYETISCKKFSSNSSSGFGHICRNTVDSYSRKFYFDNVVRESLMAFSGDYIVEGKRGVHFEHPFFTRRRNDILLFFEYRFDKIMETIFCGDRFIPSPRWFAVTVETEESKILFLTEVENVIEYAKGDGRVWFGRGDKQQNLILGNVAMYRRDGELQFKMNYKPMIKELKNKMRIFYF